MGQDERIDGDHAPEDRDLLPKSAGEIERDDQIDKLDRFFGGLNPGVSVLIERVQPSWCSGLLEEIQVTDDGLDLDYLIDTWGGHLLSLKMRGKAGKLVGGSYKVPLFTFPPLRFGELLRPYDKGGRFSQSDDSQTTPPVVVNPPPGFDKILSAVPAIMPFVIKLMENAEARNQQNMAMMMQMMQANQNQGGGITDITKIGAMMGELNTIFRQNSGGGDQGGGEVDFMAHAMDVMKMFMDNKSTPAQPQPQQPQPTQARLTSTSRRKPNAGGPPSMAKPQIPAATVTPLNPSRDVAKQLAGMDPDDISGTLIDSISQMSPDKRDAAVSKFMGEFQAYMIETEGLEGDEIDEDDDKRGVK
ncbi:MAG: hypothetical protein KAV87_17525 [Desulfobacteraceae bacterium]|nr:hypothetical protein [Desulfobacteraceae bacterium]